MNPRLLIALLPVLAAACHEGVKEVDELPLGDHSRLLALREGTAVYADPIGLRVDALPDGGTLRRVTVGGPVLDGVASGERYALIRLGANPSEHRLVVGEFGDSGTSHEYAYGDERPRFSGSSGNLAWCIPDLDYGSDGGHLGQEVWLWLADAGEPLRLEGRDRPVNVAVTSRHLFMMERLGITRRLHGADDVTLIAPATGYTDRPLIADDRTVFYRDPYVGPALLSVDTTTDGGGRGVGDEAAANAVLAGEFLYWTRAQPDAGIQLHRGPRSGGPPEIVHPALGAFTSPLHADGPYIYWANPFCPRARTSCLQRLEVTP